ncbi:MULTISPECIES: hypothetical protein [unclassified Pseudomonas]|jgi:hypothetical protein|uniref:hypothetical protein n=1 Tax=Pseudomonas sp. Irchel s3a12 TaxID=2009047 RepID=UPI000BA3032A|nr:hypothetical protein [Pseudomonas sp. Irchel s3a12]
MKGSFIKDFVALDMALFTESKEPVADWLINEIDFWKDVTSRAYPGGGVAQADVPEIVEYLHDLHRIREDLDAANGSLKVLGHRIKEANVTRRLPCFDEVLSGDFKSAVVSGEALKMGLFVYRSSMSASAVALEDFYKSWKSSLADEIKSTKESTFSELNNYQKSVNDQSDMYLKAIKEDGDAKVKLIRETAENAKIAAVEEIENYASTVTDSVISNEPVRFWDEKRKHHRFRALMFSGGAGVLIVSVVSLLGVLLHMTYSSDKVEKVDFLNITLPDHYLVALAVLLGSVGVWVLRVILKLMMTNLNLESEAYAKLTAIKTYVALSKSKLSDDTVNGFHKSLLQSGAADFSVEGTSPELVKIVELILKKQEKP